MIKNLVVFSSLVFSFSAQAAAPVVYQAKTIVALMSNDQVIGALPGGYITEVKYRDDISPFTYEIFSRDYMTTKICTTPVVMRITNSDDWNPEYGVDSVGSTSCK